MREKFAITATAELKGQKTEVVLMRNLTMAKEIASRTGGSMTSTRGIAYVNGTLTLEEYPRKQPEQPGFFERAPFLHIHAITSIEKPHGEWVGCDAAILENGLVTLISPGFGHDNTISGYTLQGGKISKFEIPLSEASETHLKAREMARLSPQYSPVHERSPLFGGRYYPVNPREIAIP